MNAKVASTVLDEIRAEVNEQIHGCIQPRDALSESNHSQIAQVLSQIECHLLSTVVKEMF